LAVGILNAVIGDDSAAVLLGIGLALFGVPVGAAVGAVLATAIYAWRERRRDST
jgi:uncharacterized MnhB-related membrane protein